ncbi:MAG: hypothetical protein ABJK28_14105 [Algibacter sp.]
MKKKILRLLFVLIITSLFCSSMIFGKSVSIYSSSDIPAIQFAANDLQQAIESKGYNVKIMPISEMTNKQEQIQFVLNLCQDDLLLQHLEAAG